MWDGGEEPGIEAPINTGCGIWTYLDLDREDNVENKLPNKFGSKNTRNSFYD